MTRNRTKRLMAYLVAVCMLVGLFPGITLVASADEAPVTVASSHYNTNQGDGITLMKKAEPNGDGTVDISIGAYTTGEVVSHEIQTPTDIVLVLDTSGSMDDRGTVITGYNLVNGSNQSWSFLGWSETRYGFNSTSTIYYVQRNDAYIPVTYAGNDNNDYDYYTDGSKYYYPIMDGNYTGRDNGYDVVQFYSAQTETTAVDKLTLLQTSVKAFIADIAARNANVAEASQHRVAIVTYAGSSNTVKGLTAVNPSTEASFNTAIDGLSASGATRIDLGMSTASNILLNKTSSVDRENVVIAFTDGVPTTNTAFSQSVAGSAVNTGATIKSLGATVYTVSMTPGTDASADISFVTSSSPEISRTNQFMHFLSSNYPNSSYSNETLYGGEGGSIASGYYMTTDDTTALEQIFDKISANIGTPHITMGSSASLTDSISSYFNLAEGTSSIAIKTVAKTADGWAETGVEDDTIDYELSNDGKTINVTGFDFDENYVSQENRGTEETPFYGKMLLITMTVVPNYNIIDAGASVHNGSVPTNADNAFLSDSNGITRAEVARPTLALPKVTYSYTIEGANETEYKSYYRLADNDTNLTVEPNISRTGYDFSGWSTSDVTINEGTYTMPNKNIEFTGNFTAKEYDVKYFYDGVVPAGASEQLPSSQAYDYNTTVNVENKPEIAGYTFSGWYTDDVTVTGGSPNTFTMPAHEVDFYGSFTPRNDTVYKVEYYFENLDDDNYAIDPNAGYERTGTTATTASAELKTFEGFTLNSGISTISGTITGDGSLVLKLYYQRNRHNVSYRYVLTVPGDANPTADELTTYEAEYKYDAPVTVKPDATATNYNFVGWNTNNVENFTTDTADFTMPDNDVQLRGYFNPASGIEYEIRHYLQNETLDGYDEDTNNIVVLTGTQDETVTINTANVDTYTGFTFVADHANNVLTGTVDGTNKLVLKLYYDRAKYNVTYEIVGESYGATIPTDDTDYAYGTTVDIKPDLSVTGYIFSGWDTEDATVEDGKFTMPAKDVTLRGRFSPAVVEWTEKHYLENIDGTPDVVIDGKGYDLDDTPTGNITHNNTTGATITVNAGHYPGFVFNTATTDTENAKNGLPPLDNNAITTTVKADGTLVVKFYYDRIKYNVEYEITGIAPIGVTVPNKESYPYDKEITVADDPSVAGYSFEGWNTNHVEGFTDTTTKFNMPNNDVILTGSFTALPAKYTVKHWLENLDGDTTTGENIDGMGWYTLDADATEEHTDRRTGALVEAVPKNYAGFSPRTDNVLEGKIAGDGSLVINVYYDRHRYNVSYLYQDDGKQPDNPPSIPDEYAKTGIQYGTELTVEDGMVLDGYTFDGWHTLTATVTEKQDGSLVYAMPDHDVIFLGKFVKKSNPKPPGGGPGGGANTRILTYESNGGTEYDQEVYGYGREVDITKAPEREGYTFEGWYLDENFTEEVDTVTMNKNITVYAKWHYTGDKTTVPDGLEGSDHFAYVIGYPDGTVRPSANITRAEVASIFFRLLKDETRDKYLTDVNNFADITDDAWYKKNVATLAALGIIEGRTATEFMPDYMITRAEFAAICARFDNSETDIVDTFTDVAGHWAENDIHEAAAHGWIKGYEDNTFRPEQFITRAEAMTLINRVLCRVPENASDLLDGMVKWSDNMDEDAWYYLAIQEATNSHDFSMKDETFEKWISLNEVYDWAKYEK